MKIFFYGPIDHRNRTHVCLHEMFGSIQEIPRREDHVRFPNNPHIYRVKEILCIYGKPETIIWVDNDNVRDAEISLKALVDMHQIACEAKRESPRNPIRRII